MVTKELSKEYPMIIAKVSILTFHPLVIFSQM